MSTSRIFTYNPEHKVISGMINIGDISIATGDTIDYSTTGVTFYNDPDEDLVEIIQLS